MGDDEWEARDLITCFFIVLAAFAACFYILYTSTPPLTIRERMLMVTVVVLVKIVQICLAIIIVWLLPIIMVVESLVILIRENLVG